MKRRVWIRALSLQIGLDGFVSLPLWTNGKPGVQIEYDDSEPIPPQELQTALVVLWSIVRTELTLQPDGATGDMRRVAIATMSVGTVDGGRVVKLVGVPRDGVSVNVRNPEPPPALCDGLVLLWRFVRLSPPDALSSSSSSSKGAT